MSLSRLARLGIGFIDLMILGCALIFIYLQITPTEDWGIMTADAGTILLIVFILYIAVVIFASICLNYMRTESTLAKLVKSFVMTILVLSLFDYLLFPVLWIFGYSFPGDVRNVLIVASIIRTLTKVWLSRRWGGEAEE